MKLTKEAISRQVSTATSIEEDFEHLKKEQVFEGDPGDLLMITGRLHLAAKVSKERYLALCTSYSLLNKCYALSHQEGQEERDRNFDESALQEMNAHIKGLDKLINKVERRNQIAEGNLRSTANSKSESDKRIIRILSDKLAARDKEIFRLKATISLSSKQHPVYNASFGCQVGPEVSSAETQTEVAEIVDIEPAPRTEEDNETADISCERDDSLILLDEDNTNEDEPMDDDQYFHKLIAEDKLQKEVEEAQRRKEVQMKEGECRELAEEVQEMERILQVYPHRHFGEAPDGTHTRTTQIRALG
ncbi:unnamed protein product [Cylicostephanus goldi]|uniref:Uncharacterized protein n=1 Tax=Cylicostephanus goldi TaxID=71465 RepID=A0A3P6SWZ5_CYLGO|nr:unnamed protein product [Cylicostephanus goldi]